MGGIFSFASYPFFIKLLWAPFVDIYYSNKIGRRKSWMIPTQIIGGLALVYLSNKIENLLTKESEIFTLTIIFSLLSFVFSTWDSAYDAWIMTILHPQNIKYASVTQTIGSKIGISFSSTIFLAINSTDFCNKYIFSVPRETPLLNLESLLYYWGVLFIFFAIVLMFVKEEEEEEKGKNLKDTYIILFNLIKLSPLQKLAIILFITGTIFVSIDGAINLVLTDLGVPQDSIGLINACIFPFEIILMFSLALIQKGDPLQNYYKFTIYKFFISAVLLTILSNIREFEIGYNYTFLIVVLTLVIQKLNTSLINTNLMTFIFKIADKSIGGTYIVFISVILHLSAICPRSFVFYFIDIFGFFRTSSCLLLLAIPLYSYFKYTIAYFMVLDTKYWKIKLN